MSEHAYWHVDDPIGLSIDDLRKAAEAYETEVHSTLTASFGDMWGPEDGAERDMGWDEAGFACVTTTLPQYYTV